MAGKPGQRPKWLPGLVWLLVLAVPVATWGLLPADGSLPRILLGIACAAVALAVLVATISAISKDRADRRWGWGVALPLVIAGVLAAVTYWIFTAPAIGANIGAGLAMFFLLPPAAAAFIVALCYTVTLEAKNSA
ncbi:hypothetical protein [Actinocrispum sp. NPDC049592]|uniref:hypothetical protein n=1 Tax=Actinocrispum sp. NPDC049592 TaxID=3154835 RepID=UPI00341B9ACF